MADETKYVTVANPDGGDNLVFENMAAASKFKKVYNARKAAQGQPSQPPQKEYDPKVVGEIKNPPPPSQLSQMLREYVGDPIDKYVVEPRSLETAGMMAGDYAKMANPVAGAAVGGGLAGAGNRIEQILGMITGSRDNESIEDAFTNMGGAAVRGASGTMLGKSIGP